jgi:RnfABCDGE-type electron transport complex C subunit
MNAIASKVRAAGVVGAGGAGFPTHVKLDSQVDTVIGNGAECEPLLKADQYLMTRRATQVVEGLRLAMQATGAKRGIMALKREYEEAVQALTAAVQGARDITLHLMGSYYPAGDEFLLVYEATGRIVPEAGIPLAVGVVVQNVGTLCNIAAAQEGAPVTHRLLTVSGEANEPKTLSVPLGTPFEQVITWAGGYARPAEELALVAGGPMMGWLASPSDVVTKTTSGLLALPKQGPVVSWMCTPVGLAVRRGRSTCDQCRDCTDLCPRHLIGHDLQPHEIMRSINYGLDWPTGIVTAAVLCCECRLCEAYACPLGLSPMKYYREVKRQLAEQGWKNDVHHRSDLTAHVMFDFRRVPMHRLIDRLGLTKYRIVSVAADESEHSPESVRIPLKQHIGAPAMPVVKAGDAVKAGDLVAEIPEKALGANVHASIPGRVRRVTEQDVVIEREQESQK